MDPHPSFRRMSTGIKFHFRGALLTVVLPQSQGYNIVQAQGEDRPLAETGQTGHSRMCYTEPLSGATNHGEVLARLSHVEESLRGENRWDQSHQS